MIDKRFVAGATRAMILWDLIGFALCLAIGLGIGYLLWGYR